MRPHIVVLCQNLICNFSSTLHSQLA